MIFTHELCPASQLEKKKAFVVQCALAISPDTGSSPRQLNFYQQVFLDIVLSHLLAKCFPTSPLASRCSRMFSPSAARRLPCPSSILLSLFSPSVSSTPPCPTTQLLTVVLAQCLFKAHFSNRRFVPQPTLRFTLCLPVFPQSTLVQPNPRRLNEQKNADAPNKGAPIFQHIDADASRSRNTETPQRRNARAVLAYSRPALPECALVQATFCCHLSRPPQRSLVQPQFCWRLFSPSVSSKLTFPTSALFTFPTDALFSPFLAQCFLKAPLSNQTRGASIEQKRRRPQRRGADISTNRRRRLKNETPALQHRDTTTKRRRRLNEDTPTP